MKLTDISAVVVSHNNEQTIGRCLDSLRDFGETVIVDAFSTDRTLEIARGHPAVVYSRPALLPERQLGWVTGRVRGSWVLLVEGHDRVSRALVARLRSLGDSNEASGYWVSRRTEYLGQKMRRCGLLGRCLGLVRVDASGAGARSAGPTASLPDAIVYRHLASVEDHLAAIQAESDADSRRVRGGRGAIVQMLVRPVTSFVGSYLLGGGLVDGKNGFVFCLLSSYRVFLTYAKAWEAGRDRSTD